MKEGFWQNQIPTSHDFTKLSGESQRNTNYVLCVAALRKLGYMTHFSKGQQWKIRCRRYKPTNPNGEFTVCIYLTFSDVLWTWRTEWIKQNNIYMYIFYNKLNVYLFCDFRPIQKCVLGFTWSFKIEDLILLLISYLYHIVYVVTIIFNLSSQGLMILLQNLPTMHWGNEEVSVLLAEAYRLKFAFADAPNHYKRWDSPQLPSWMRWPQPTSMAPLVVTIIYW